MPVAEMRPLPTPKSPLPGWPRYGQAVNPSKMKYLFTTLILLTCALTAFCRPVDTVEVHTGQDEGIVSPLIMGFNTVYCSAPDNDWNSHDGKIPSFIDQLVTRVLRSHAGPVDRFFTWEQPHDKG